MQKNRRKAPYIFAESFGTEPTSGVICVLQVPHLGHENPYHPVQFPYVFGNKPHLFAAIFERFYTERQGYPTPRKVAKAILHPVLHPTLHLKPSVNTGYPGHWCRKCRIFSQTFLGEKAGTIPNRDMGTRKHRTSLRETSVLSRQNIGTFPQRSPMFLISEKALHSGIPPGFKSEGQTVGSITDLKTFINKKLFGENGAKNLGERLAGLG